MNSARMSHTRFFAVAAMLLAAIVLHGVPSFAQSDPDEDSRELTLSQLRALIRLIEETEATEPTQAARDFDRAWARVVEGEDPIVPEAENEDDNSLKPGEHRLDAGFRVRLLRIFLQASPEFRRAWQDFVRSAAEDALQNAADNAPRSLTQTILRYQFTPVAQRTLEALIRVKMSRGEFLSAALQWGRLMNLRNDSSAESKLQLAALWWNAGLPEEARSWFAEVVQSDGGRQVSIVGTTIQIPETTNELDAWIRRLSTNSDFLAAETTEFEWGQRLGNYRRTMTQQSGPARLDERWRVSAFESSWFPEMNSMLEPLARRIRRLAQQQLERNWSIAPAAAPLIVGDLLVFRGVVGIRTVNRHTGELVWESALPDRQIKDGFDAARRDGGASAANSVQIMLQDSLLRHLVRANTAGQLTRAGNSIFAVEEVTSATINTNWNGKQESASRRVNYLRAYDLRSGQWQGMLGGTVGLSDGDAAPNPLKGFYILGAPVVIGERIYVMAENDTGIFLLQLESNQLDQTSPPYTLKPVHSQLLTSPGLKLLDHPVRMYAGVTPSFGRGLLICNTCDEKIVAVSAEDHSVRWVYRYPTNVATGELIRDIGVIGDAFGRRASDQIDLGRRWQDALPRILTDRIIVSPRDSTLLIALDLQTGRQLWTRPRGDLGRIVHTDDERIVLTGTDTVQCLSTKTGDSIWKMRFQHGFVCGKSASDGTVLHVPTSEPAIVSIDITTGRRLISQPVSDGWPGNLLLVDGRIYSQSLTDVRCFAGSEEQSPGPVELANRQLLDGHIAEAETILQEIIRTESGDDPEKKRQAAELLSETLLESLRMDYRGNASRVAEVRSLIEQSAPREQSVLALTESFLGMTPRDMNQLTSLWKKVDGPYRQLERLQMLRARYQLRGFEGTEEELAQQIIAMLDESFPIRTSVGRIGSLHLQISRAIAGAIRTAVRDRSAASADKIQQLVSAHISEQIQNSDTALDADWWMNICLQTGFLNPAVQYCLQDETAAQVSPSLRRLVTGAALSVVSSADNDSLLKAWADSGSPRFTASLIARSNRQSAAPGMKLDNIPATRSVSHNLSLPDLNAAETLQPLLNLSDEDAREPFQGTPTVRVSDDRSVSPQAALGGNAFRFVIPLIGPSGAFPRWSFVMRMGSEGVQAIDAAGQHRWSFQLDRSLGGLHRNYGPQFNTVSRYYAVAWDRFLVLKMNQLVFVLDCADADEQTPPRLLWDLNIYDQFPPPSTAQRVTQAWQRTTQYSLQPSGLFPLGPISSFGVPIYCGQRLVMFDLVSGKRHWQIEGLPDDATLTATDNELILISQAAGTAQCRSLVDGTELRNTPLPDWWTDAAENSNASVRDFDLNPGSDLRWRMTVENGNCLLFRLNTKQSALELYGLRDGAVRWTVDLPQDSVVSNVVDGHVAVVSDGQKLQILNLISGTIEADVDIPPAPNSRFLYLRPSAGRWIVLTDVFDPDPDDENPVGSGTVHVNGPMCAINQTTGELDWSTDVKHRWLKILTPAQSPFPPVMPLLVLLKQPYRYDDNGNIRGARVQAHIYDTRTGQILYDDEDLGLGTSYHRLNSSSRRNQIEIGFDRRNILFDYNRDEDDGNN